MSIIRRNLLVGGRNMALRELLDFLGDEKAKLLKAVGYIDTYYQQIASSLEALRDNLLPYSFSPRATWKEAIEKRAAVIRVPEITPRNVYGDPDFNSGVLVQLINNILAVQNTALANPEAIGIDDCRLIVRSHRFLLAFLEEQFSNSNIASLQKPQRDLAFSVRLTIEKRVRENIDPFFAHLEMILDDVYRVTLAGHVQPIVGTLANYKKNPALYDDLIGRQCRELGLKNSPEQNLAVIADLEKPEAVLAAEVKAKYEGAERKTPSRYYRLKEIALRYGSQADNLAALIYFLKETERSLLHISLGRRIGLFLRSLFSTRKREISSHNIAFTYVPDKGKIERRRASLNDLIGDASYYYKYLVKFKEDFSTEAYTSTRTSTPRHAQELEKFIDTSFSSLAQVLEKCHGFRDWLGRENNRRLLRRIPERRQEDFNNLLLHITRTCIVNNYNLQEFDKVR
jgi:hypothetical protein